MITVKFLGGAKKSFATDQVKLDKSNIDVNELFQILISIKPENTFEFDTKNILVAINNVDSSALDGKHTVIKNNDVVSIIPVIHGGLTKRANFTISKKNIQIMEINGKKSFNPIFLDNVRNDFPKLKIQAVSSNFILSLSHAKKILFLSLESQKNNVLLSNKLETDILMRFALTSQISEAINVAGIKSGKNFSLIAIGEKKQLESLYFKLNKESIPLFSNNNNKFLKKYSKINEKQLKNLLSKNPLEDLLVEKASVLF